VTRSDFLRRAAAPSRRQALAIVSSATLSAFAFACTERTRSTLIIGGGPNVSMLVIVAQLKKFFEHRQLMTEYRSLQTSKIAFDAVAAQQIDIGVVTDANMALIGFAGFGDVRIIGSVMTKMDDAIIARRDVGIDSPMELRGKRIAYTPASSGEAFLNLFLAHLGLNPDEVTLITMTPPAMLVALQHRQVDAITVWQPFRYNIAASLGENGIQFQNDGIYPAKILLIATSETITVRADKLRQLFAALLDASSYVRANPAESTILLAPEIGVDAYTLTATWPEYEFQIDNTKTLADDLDRIAHAMAATQPDLRLKPIPDYRASISSAIQQEVLEAQGRI
jgi:ABC-type nitrate/sulfonate/bicarbonate transport system substrate-binding protein